MHSFSIFKLCCLLGLLFSTINASAQSRIASQLELGGAWQFLPIERVPVTSELPLPTKGWQSIKVPGNWYRQGRDISGQAWYQKEFMLDRRQSGRHAQLVFKGVDYRADVWLNGHYLGQHIGYFQAFEFDVSKHLVEGKNTLTVLVDSPLEAPQDWSLHKRLIKGIFSHHDTRPGGAWSERGQEQNTGGIWAPVAIEFSDDAALRELTVTPRKSKSSKLADRWDVEAFGNVSSDVSHETSITIEADITPENFKGKSYQFKQTYTLRPGQNNLALKLPVDKPELWWPAEYGQPNLYRLKLTLKDEGKNNRILDQQDKVIGFREVRVDDRLQWFINGHRMFLRGTNYIASQWLADMSPERFKQDLTMMQKANINAIRVHAHVSAPTFYDLCDRMGILVTQDFPLLWGYSDDEAFTIEARSQAQDMVKGLNHHPSIISWTMHNEPPWDSPWMAQKYPAYTPDINRKLDELLYADVKKLDDLRVVRKESGIKEHEWMGWYFDSWQSFTRPAPNPWSTEFGAQALPHLSSLKRMFKADELWPDTEAKWKKWEFHNFQRKETFELAHVAQGKNIEEFIHNTQHYQARLIQFAVENYRRQRYAPVSAVFQFMFVENWPSINWGVVDYWRQPKAGYEALRVAYQPILPSLEWQQDEYKAGESPKIGLWAINDTWQGYEHASYTITLYNNGKQIDQLKLPLEMLPDSGHKLRDYPLPSLQPGQYELKAQIADRNGKLMGSNHYRFEAR
ncbi:beta galactosidase jelly roll domain-containing protein [Methylobacillus gramineus]|uniref:glycoside hydrolase family 2 protein n=1 Tax=Methylobacillus gramineus TaxID=755169 RepID=UPI001CFFD534|nr:sugar-binding domain-containing protein [Methylobacillus gramineus]MCB5185709.1 beta galactosidase jelly roll domain-containing protein [Methylobacillus gramineus]